MTSNIYEFIGTRIRPIELATILKRVLRIKRRFFTLNGNYFFLDPVSNFGLRLLRDGYYEPEITELILNNLEDGDTFIDLGGNEGYFSILASRKVGKSGSIFCIEPQSRLWEIIAKNINKNNCYNISLVPYAASEIATEISITLTPSLNTGSSSIVKENRKRFWREEKLNTATLDELFLRKEIDSIKLMKVDIEGYEFFALKGAIGLLEKKILKNIIIEFHPTQLKELGQSIQDIHSFLAKFGYVEKSGVFSC